MVGSTHGNRVAKAVLKGVENNEEAIDRGASRREPPSQSGVECHAGESFESVVALNTMRNRSAARHAINEEETERSCLQAPLRVRRTRPGLQRKASTPQIPDLLLEE
jgi:hypothetical protein